MKAIVILAALTPMVASGLTPEEIVRKMDENMTFETRIADGTMTVFDTDGSSEVRKLKIWARGASDSYVRFVSPARDKGIKYLKREDNLYMYMPRTEKVVKISGHMLRQSLMDSDFSYEDMLESRKLLESYGVAIAGEESIDGDQCWVLELTAKKAGTTYARRKLWVSKKTFVARKAERYAKSGVLLKVVLQSRIIQHGERYYPAVTEMRDTLKKGTRTTFELSNMRFDVNVPSKLFSRRNLMRGN